MDLTVDCPHCIAKAGELCEFDCDVNGEKLEKLKEALNDIDLSMKNLKVN